MTQLSDKTVLTNFSVSRWGGYRFDKKATNEVHRTNEAAADTGSYNKRLLVKGATAKIDSVVNGARVYHKTHTLPWLDNGVRILPSTNYMEYAAQMKDYRQEFDQEVANFLVDYPTLCKQAKGWLGKLYNEEDYPTVKQLQGCYSWEVTILPFPDVRDFRVVGVDDMAAIKKDLTARMESVWQEAMKDVAERVIERVGRMKERLAAYKPPKGNRRAENTFKDSLVANVRELVDLLPSFNLTNDPKLAKIIVTMQKDLCTHDAEALRDDDKLRKKVATSADAVLSAVADFIA